MDIQRHEDRVQREIELEKKVSGFFRATREVTRVLSAAIVLLFITVVVSAVVSVFFVRGCWSRADGSILSNSLCGSIGQEELHGMRWLRMKDFSIRSRVPESPEFSLAKGTGAANLIDGLSSTKAYPAAREFDYEVDFLEPYAIEQIEILWGEQGAASTYIQNWKLLGLKRGGSEWESIAMGEFPNSERTIITEELTVTAVRITARSKENWIGINELRVRGRPTL